MHDHLRPEQTERYATDTLSTGPRGLPYVVTDAEDVRSTKARPHVIARFAHASDAEAFRNLKNLEQSDVEEA